MQITEYSIKKQDCARDSLEKLIPSLLLRLPSVFTELHRICRKNENGLNDDVVVLKMTKWNLSTSTIILLI